MRKVILFGASGNLGQHIAKELVSQNYDLTLVVRNEAKAKALSHICSKYIIADVCNKNGLEKVLDNQEIVVSALGKSVSLNDKSKQSFWDVDFNANANILNEAKKSGIQKFVYVSALHSEKYLHLDYFKVHHEFSELLKNSGINYSIIKPPAIFCAFLDVIELARKGQLVHLGSGDKKTNPIYEGDLAKITVDSINKTNCVIEAGGKKTYSRKELNEIIQNAINPGKKIRTIPLGMIKTLLPVMKFFNRNSYDKFAFYLEVMQHDTIAPPLGEMTFENYIALKTKPQ